MKPLLDTRNMKDMKEDYLQMMNAFQKTTHDLFFAFTKSCLPTLMFFMFLLS